MPVSAFRTRENCARESRRRHTTARQPSAWLPAGLLSLALANSLTAANGYLVHNLVSDLPGLADHVDKNLVNPWGNAFSPTSPFWISNNHSGTSTLYDGTGTPLTLVVSVPGPPGTASKGAITGVMWNSTMGFVIGQGGRPASFMFCGEDGAISGWNSGTAAAILLDNSSAKAVYKGCTLGGTSAAPLLFAANFNSGKVDVFDGTLKPVVNAGAFTDPMVPAGFAPFNIANLGGNLFVSYARQDSAHQEDVPGPGNGYVSMFTQSGTLMAHLIAQAPLNSPWGMAIAPATFGSYAGALLVGNFGDGAINAFDRATGKLLGTLNDIEGGPISIPGLWSLEFGNGPRSDTATLYFTAGIPGPFGEPVESHGLLGSIQPSPTFQTASVVNAASAAAPLAANTFLTITGGALATTSRAWRAGDFVGGKLPTSLNGVAVSVNGAPAYISFISPSQINALLPASLPQGTAKIQTINNGLLSQEITVNLQSAGPAFFTLTGNKYVAATHVDGSLSAPPGLITGVTSTPAKPGETLVLYANGCGATAQPVPDGQVITAAIPLAAMPSVTMGGLNAQVMFAGLVASGLYQINVVVPTGLTPGDNAVAAQVGGMTTQSGVFVSIGQ